MAPSVSKPQGETAVGVVEQGRKNALTQASVIHAFQSVMQHVLLIQSEPMLIKELCNGDTAESAKLLANSAGLVGILGLFANQAGGKLSDIYGRKPFLLMGPIMNIISGLIVYSNHKNRFLVLACRVARMVMTTFSNTVIVGSALGDLLVGDEHKAASVKISAAIGAAVVCTPFIEAEVLKRTSHCRYTYLALAVVSSLQVLTTSINFPETLDYAKRATLANLNLLSAVNPLAFLNIYRKGSRALSGMVTVTSFQLMLDGRNLSDITEIWKRDHLKWTMEQSRNFIGFYGIAVFASSALFGERLLKSMTNRGFTTFTNTTSALAFLMRGTTKSWLFLLATIPLLPGVNGASTKALVSRCTELVREEGFGQGEFQAWSNNLRAVASTIQPILVGYYYAWCMKKGKNPRSVFWLLGFMGAVLPEILMRVFMKDSEIESAPKPSLTRA